MEKLVFTLFVLLVFPVKVAVDLVAMFCWDNFLLSFLLLDSISFLRQSLIPSSELACWSFRFSELVFMPVRSVACQGFFISCVCHLSAQAHYLFSAESIPAQPGLLLRLCTRLLHPLDSCRFPDSVLPMEHAGLSIPVTGCHSKARFFFTRVCAPASWLVLPPGLFRQDFWSALFSCIQVSR
jgi:hypothetical protein